MSSDADDVLLALLGHLAGTGYRFVTPTPETHWRVLARKAGPAADLREAFGWNLPFAVSLLPEPLFDQLAGAGLIAEDGGLPKSRVRVSTIGDRLFVHSAFPTAEGAVFLGPDSYRSPPRGRCRRAAGPRLVDIGAGAGSARRAAGCCRTQSHPHRHHPIALG